MSGSCRDCGHDLCICDTITARFESSPSDGIVIRDERDIRLAALEWELVEARDKVTTLQAAVMAHKTWENEAVAQASNANLALNKIRVENAALRAEVDLAARWMYAAGANDYCEAMKPGGSGNINTDAAWSRYQQERDGGEGR